MNVRGGLEGISQYIENFSKSIDSLVSSCSKRRTAKKINKFHLQFGEVKYEAVALYVTQKNISQVPD